MDRLKIQTLPTEGMFRNRVAFDRIVGFESVRNRDDFPNFALRRKLVKAIIIKPKNKYEIGIRVKYRADSDSSGGIWS